ncbi:hypothetical protein BKA61DRAFT_108323 [Leptodontidium sp. MPI-SDFR-AT-0119]|nr:hypothetical protein BKA61DRAFT_108323 [Leptodontidium sp. MPI-SDFR-AT-0119]
MIFRRMRVKSWRLLARKDVVFMEAKDRKRKRREESWISTPKPHQVLRKRLSPLHCPPYQLFFHNCGLSLYVIVRMIKNETEERYQLIAPEQVAENSTREPRKSDLGMGRQCCGYCCCTPQEFAHDEQPTFTGTTHKQSAVLPLTISHTTVE